MENRSFLVGSHGDWLDFVNSQKWQSDRNLDCVSSVERFPFSNDSQWYNLVDRKVYSFKKWRPHILCFSFFVQRNLVCWTTGNLSVTSPLESWKKFKIFELTWSVLLSVLEFRYNSCPVRSTLVNELPAESFYCFRSAYLASFAKHLTLEHVIMLSCTSHSSSFDSKTHLQTRQVYSFGRLTYAGGARLTSERIIHSISCSCIQLY